MPSRDAVARDCHRFLGQLARPVLRFTSEAHGVMSARLVLFASGAPDAAREAERMFAEKIAAFADAHATAERASADGLGIFAAAEPVKLCVSANGDRLGVALH